MNEHASDPTDLRVWPTSIIALKLGLNMVRFAAIAGIISATLVAGMMVLGLMPVPAPVAFGDATAMTPAGEASPIADMVLLAASFMLTAAFTVFFHRHVMIGHVAPVRLQFTKRESRFLLATLFYTAAAAVPSLGFALLAGMAGGIGGVALGPYLALLAMLCVVLFLLVRFALAFPAIAVDAPGSLVAQFRYSYQATKGRFGRLFSIYVVSFFLFALVAAVLSVVFGMVIAAMVSWGISMVALAWAAILVQVTFQFTALAVFASIASQAFIAWSGWSPESILHPADDAPLV